MAVQKMVEKMAIEFKCGNITAVGYGLIFELSCQIVIKLKHHLRSLKKKIILIMEPFTLIGFVETT